MRRIVSGLALLLATVATPAAWASFHTYQIDEIFSNADGSVHKVTIAKTSGKTEFDVAAVDTVLSAAPYEPTPEAIRSVNGKIYLRWGFYRNWRQCGTFNVEPYILTSVPGDDSDMMISQNALKRDAPSMRAARSSSSGILS